MYFCNSLLIENTENKDTDFLQSITIAEAFIIPVFPKDKDSLSFYLVGLYLSHWNVNNSYSTLIDIYNHRENRQCLYYIDSWMHNILEYRNVLMQL